MIEKTKTVMIQSMQRLVVFVLLVLAGSVTALMASETYSTDDIDNVHLKDKTQYVSNPDGVLSSQSTARLNAAIKNVWDQTSAEMVVVAVNDINTDPDEFATDLMEKWGVGKKDKDNGVILLIVKDQRKAVIRTGDGMEGVLPDIVCGRILREDMFPRFKEGDYDGGTEAAVSRMSRVITDPKYAAELKSDIANDARPGRGYGGHNEEEDLWGWLLKVSMFVGVVCLIVVVATIVISRKDQEHKRYESLNSMKTLMLFLSFMCLGMPLPAYLLLIAAMHRIRNHARKCPNCSTKMKKLDEETDNKYLTPAEDTEERLNSIDYDVWLCPTCGETDVIPYVNKHSSYRICERCGARTSTLTENRTIMKPTTTRPGRGVRIYTCRNCGHRKEEPYELPKVASAAPVVIIPGGFGGRGGGFGGGFGGGSFGGGGTAGGGASGGW